MHASTRTSPSEDLVALVGKVATDRHRAAQRADNDAGDTERADDRPHDLGKAGIGEVEDVPRGVDHGVYKRNRRGRR